MGGTGLCSYGVRGVDGSRAEHLTVESCRSLSVNFLVFFSVSVAQPGGAGARPPEIGFTRKSHKKIPGCAVELNTQNCAWFASQISLITLFRQAVFQYGTIPPSFDSCS